MTPGLTAKMAGEIEAEFLMVPRHAAVRLMVRLDAERASDDKKGQELRPKTGQGYVALVSHHHLSRATALALARHALG